MEMQSLTVQLIPLSQLVEHPDNPRKIFDIEELTRSVKTAGILSPLQVRKLKSNFQILSGARRFRSAKAAGLTAAPAIVREVNDEEALEFLINANLQTNPTPLEEAVAFGRLQDRGYSMARIAAATSKTERYVYDSLALLKLIPAAMQHLTTGRITVQLATILAHQKADVQKRAIDPETGGLFQQVTQHGLSMEFFTEDKDEWANYKAVTPRELSAWLNQHSRFEKTAVDQMLFPETHAVIKSAVDAKEKIVQVTHNHYTQPDAKLGNTERIFHVSSWKAADGSDKDSKKCDYSVVGLIVAGPEQGKALRVCVNKACDVHWKAEAKRKASGNVERTKKDASFQARLAAQQKLQELEEQKRKDWKKAAPAIVKACAEKIKKAPLGALVEILLRRHDVRQVMKEKLLPKWKTADDFLRAIALADIVDDVGNSWSAVRNFPAQAKRFGLNVKPFLDAAAKERHEQV